MKNISDSELEHVSGGMTPKSCGCAMGGGGGAIRPRIRKDRENRTREANEGAAGGHDSRGTGNRSRRRSGQRGREIE